jgi:hypothetical protein
MNDPNVGGTTRTMPRNDQRVGTRRWFGAASSVAGWIGVALMPKCPLCVAVALSGLGVGATWATALSPYVRGAAWSVAGAALLFTLFMEGRRILRRRASPGRGIREPSCCSVPSVGVIVASPARGPLAPDMLARAYLRIRYRFRGKFEGRGAGITNA